MQIDTTAMLQGILDARDANEISDDLCSELQRLISKVSKPGKLGRQECDYARVLEQIGLAAYASHLDDVPLAEYARLWKRLGDSISSVISVAINDMEG